MPGEGGGTGPPGPPVSLVYTRQFTMMYYHLIFKLFLS